jgi:uncharacterized membrane protein HdeD (DUF308 family)
MRASITAAVVAGSVSTGQVLLGVSGLVFGYIVVRLLHAMLAAHPARRRTALRGLIITAVVPVLVLTPTEIGSSRPEFAPLILLVCVTWLALAMSYTSYALARTARPATADTRTQQGIRAFVLAMQTAVMPFEAQLRRLSHTLLCRGGAMMALGLGAILWPEPFLVRALIAVGALAALSGLYEIVIGFSIRPHGHVSGMVVVHGAASILFGLMTVSAPGLALQGALMLIAPWFLLYAGLALRGAVLVWPIPGMRRTLLVWGAFDMALAILVGLAPAQSIFALLFSGAVYTALFGMWQVALGFCCRELYRRHGNGLHSDVLANGRAS